MERAEIKQVADYIKDLEEGLGAWDYRGPITLGEPNGLYVIITHQIDGNIGMIPNY